MASATSRSSWALTASAPRWRSAGSRLRPRALRRETRGSGLRRRPIHHPLSGKTVGAVDLPCWRKDADPLLIALARTTADQVTKALFAAGSAPELELLQEYLRACRHAGGMVVALNNEMVMMNEHARQALDPGDQVVLLGHAADALASRDQGRSS
jgi:hypothetical protein